MLSLCRASHLLLARVGHRSSPCVGLSGHPPTVDSAAVSGKGRGGKEKKVAFEAKFDGQLKNVGAEASGAEVWVV